MSISSFRAGGVSRVSGSGAIGLRGFSITGASAASTACGAGVGSAAGLGGLATARANSIEPGTPWIVWITPPVPLPMVKAPPRPLLATLVAGAGGAIGVGLTGAAAEGARPSSCRAKPLVGVASCCPSSSSIPVATTETRTVPSSDGSIDVPVMMLLSGMTSRVMRLAASSTSYMVRSGPPEMFSRTPLADFRLTSSSSGFLMARSAASSARFSPSASPVPIIDLPITVISARTSAKSRLMLPGRTIRSEIARTPSYSTSSAIFSASA